MDPSPTQTLPAAPVPTPTTAAVVEPTSPVVVNVTTPTAAWLTPVLIVSALALTFTVFSFWWIQVRRGRLVTYPPQSYAGAFGDAATIAVPLVLHNTGPAPLVVTDFQLRLARAGTSMTLPWTALQGQLEPAGTVSGGTRTMPAAFAVNGRDAESKFVEFQNRRATIDLRTGPATATVYVRLGARAWWDRLLRPSDQDGWTPLLTFTLNTHLKGIPPGVYTARTNDPAYLDAHAGGDSSLT